MSAVAKRTVLAAASVAALVVTMVAPGGSAAPPDRDRTPPSTPQHMRVIAATPSLVSVAWDPSTDDVGVAGYYVFGDKGKATVDEPEYLVKELRCGESTVLTVIALDDAQNRSDKATLTVATAPCQDTQPPAVPTGFTQLATTRDAVVLGWSPSSDDTGVVEYGVYRNLQRVATTAEPNVTLSGLACGLTYPYLVDAADSAGNRSRQANVYVQTAACVSAGDSTPPSTPTGLAAAGVTQTGLSLSWNASSDNVGVVGYDVYRNGAKVASPTTTSVSQSGLTCGASYALEVSARDAAGNASQRAQLTVSTSACASPSPTDSTPPSTPTGLAAAGVTQTGLSLSWNASSDNVGVVGYDVYRNGAKVASPTTTSVSQSGLTCGASYALEVSARDAAGNASQRAQLTVSTSACASPSPTDSTPPSTPTGLAAAGVTQTGLSLSWNASSDNVGVVGYDVYRNGAKVASPTTTSVSQSGLTCGASYALEVSARDAAGNASQRAQLTVSTSACASPSPTDSTPPSQPTNLGISDATRTAISLMWKASTDNVGVTGYSTYVNGAPTVTTAQPGTTVSSLKCGTAYTFAVDAYDAAANRSSKASVIGSTVACADTQSPTPPSNVVVTSRTATSIALTWSPSSDNVGVAGYGVYRAGEIQGTSMSTSWIYASLMCNTNYTLAVDAYDAAGNRSSETTVMVATTACPDTTPPSTPTGLSVLSVAPNSLTLTWNASTDNVGVTSYDVFRNGTKLASVASTSASQGGLLCATSYAFGVEALDAAGNRSQRTSLNVTTGACPPTPSGCSVDQATMTAVGCTLLRDDSAAAVDPEPGLWGNVEAVSDSRHQLTANGGDPHLKANGAVQGNSAFRRLSVLDGDDFFGERAELGRNRREDGENTGSQTSGTFALYNEGERKITFFSMRFGSGFTSALDGWQCIMQMKQAQGYAANGPVNSAPAFTLQVWGGRLRLDNFWTYKWTTPAPANGVWFRLALDVTYSKDPTKGKVQVFVDANGDGVADSVSPVITMATLAYASTAGAGLNVGDPIPDHLRLGIYHDASVYGTSSVDVDNVQVVGV